ncbi:lysis protein [Pseudomonas chlororaphis subsp. aurantiaca]|uniref:lysis system i-spanin subunit Rz n=1 Tax=Pseudomonas chlororaphis TaxID=587753 RepID=UPI00050D419C|nr:lysis system i-spanin subunit Rz [Pseudomonas chlororaphis]AIS15523.1 lysis protein [Pseudomonas chlororaphis subsp. aurantiaca]
MTFSPFRLLLVVLLIAGAAWFAFDQVLQQRDNARSERDQAQDEAKGLREAARITGERLAKAAAFDTQHTQELNDALKRIKDLQRAVDRGDQRLLIQARCPAVPAGSGATGLADAATAELSTDARSDYFTLRDQLAHSRQMILGLQDHVRTFCTPNPTE